MRNRKSENDLLSWLGLRGLATMDFSKAQILGSFLGFLISAALALLLIIGFGSLIRLAGIVTGLGAPPPGFDIRGIDFLLAALFGAPFVIWRTNVAQKQAETAKQGLITDRFNKAVEGLGMVQNVKRQAIKSDGTGSFGTHPDGSVNFTDPIMEEVTTPNLEVRIGAIYSLERIAQDSLRDHVQIMEIICAYVRGNAPCKLDTNKTKYPGREWDGVIRPNQPSANLSRQGRISQA